MSKMASKYVWLFALVVVWGQCLHPSVCVTTRSSLSSLMKILSQQTDLWCRNLTSRGCCVPKPHNGCRVNATFSCYCDASCESLGDCCEDMKELGCNDLPATCVAQRLNTSSGCCKSNTPEGCAARNRTTSNPCYCDHGCHEKGDCCSDIADVGCFPTGCENGRKRKCCRYRSNYCRVRTSPTDHCYCDSDCIKRGDCCPDMPKSCARPESSLTKSEMQTEDNLLEVMEAKRKYERMAAAYLWRLQQASRVRSQNGRN